jgi:uncharacterized membrane protein YqjE
MSDTPATSAAVPTVPPAAPPTHTPAPQDASVGELVSRIQEQTVKLLRDELRLAQLEMAQTGKKAGLGIGLFGGSGIIALYAIGALIAAAILGLAGPVSPWLAALIVGIALLVVAGVAALIGKREVAAATPPVPEEAIAGAKQDVNAFTSRGRS